MPRSGAASRTRRRASAPARWPAVRGRPRAAAQRPLPSMIIATWRPGCPPVDKDLCITEFFPTKKALSAARGPDQRFHVLQVMFESLAAGGCQLVLGAGNATFESLVGSDVARILQPASVRADVAIG